MRNNVEEKGVNGDVCDNGKIIVLPTPLPCYRQEDDHDYCNWSEIFFSSCSNNHFSGPSSKVWSSGWCGDTWGKLMSSNGHLSVEDDPHGEKGLCMYVVTTINASEFSNFCASSLNFLILSFISLFLAMSSLMFSMMDEKNPFLAEYWRHSGTLNWKG